MTCLRLWRPLVALGVLAALSACVSIERRGPGAPPAPMAPSAPSASGSASFDLGDWRNASPDAVEAAFARSVARWGGRGPLPEVAAAVRANGFSCASGGGGDPAQVCSREIREGGCAHTWQVLVSDPGRDGTADAARGVYDRVCASSRLLGAPPR